MPDDDEKGEYDSRIIKAKQYDNMREAEDIRNSISRKIRRNNEND